MALKHAYVNVEYTDLGDGDTVHIYELQLSRRAHFVYETMRD